jgi:xanthine dehydrogenase accessory factor
MELARIAAAFGICTEVHTPDNGLALNSVPSGVKVDRWTAIIMLFHDHEWEGVLLEWALSTQAFYIGAQGGEKPRKQRIDWLKSRNVADDMIQRIISPMGLILRARDARTLALSALADVVDHYERLRP